MEKHNEELEEIIKHDRARYDEVALHDLSFASLTHMYPKIIIKYDALAVELSNAELDCKDAEDRLKDIDDEVLLRS